MAAPSAAPPESPPWVKAPIGEEFTRAFAGSRAGEMVTWPRPLDIGGQRFDRAAVIRVYGTASGARLLHLLPGGPRCIWKLGDVRHEHAVMSALRHMNRRWRRCGLAVCGFPVQAVTYDILPIAAEAGLVEVVHGSSTLRELGSECSREEKHLRVLRALANDTDRLNRLAATTVAYLTAGYALGVRDGHDDNIMLRSDGSLFRIDFGFVFGATPEIDTPQTVVPRAVAFALGERRWKEVVNGCRYALLALTGEVTREPPAWDCLSNVPELASFMNQALAHVQTLDFEDFRRDVECADQWSFSRAAKNALREAVRFWTDAEDDIVPLAAAKPEGSSSSWTSAERWQQPAEKDRPEEVEVSALAAIGMLPGRRLRTMAVEAAEAAFADWAGPWVPSSQRSGDAKPPGGFTSLHGATAWPAPRWGFAAEGPGPRPRSPVLVATMPTRVPPLPRDDPFAATPPASPRDSRRREREPQGWQPRGRPSAGHSTVPTAGDPRPRPGPLPPGDPFAPSPRNSLRGFAV